MRCDAAVPTFSTGVYRVNLVVADADLGLIDSDLDLPPSCPVDQPILPNSHLPKLNWAENETPTIHVNPTKVHNHQM